MAVTRCSGLRTDSQPPPVGCRVRAHARALMAISSDVAAVGREAPALEAEHMAPDTRCLDYFADTGRMGARQVCHLPNAGHETEVATRHEVLLVYRGRLIYDD